MRGMRYIEPCDLLPPTHAGEAEHVPDPDPSPVLVGGGLVVMAHPCDCGRWVQAT